VGAPVWGNHKWAPLFGVTTRVTPTSFFHPTFPDNRDSSQNQIITLLDWISTCVGMTKSVR
jgi:hypothetical protein